MLLCVFLCLNTKKECGPHRLLLLYLEILAHNLWTQIDVLRNLNNALLFTGDFLSIIDFRDSIEMASAAKSTTSTPGSGVFLAWAIHVYAWFLGRYNKLIMYIFINWSCAVRRFLLVDFYLFLPFFRLCHPSPSVVLVLANGIHLFLPPWCVIPIAGWAIGT